ncbi:MAG TPA: hypothetical protein VGA21_08535 [Cyclobacteriaceae bacterium]|jgi:hypothetical protein
MHLGIVHDDGPSAMANGPQKRVGEIFVFDHDDKSDTKFIIYNFNNGELGNIFEYLRGQLVNLKFDDKDDPIITEGKVTVTGIASTDSIGFKETEDGYKNWRNEQALVLKPITGRRPVI